MEYVTEKFKSLSLFGESVGFVINRNGNTTFKSVVGALASLLVILTTLSFGSYKFVVMSSKGDTKH